MRFLTIISLREAFLTLPSSVMRQIILGFQENMKRLKEQGKVLDIAFMPSGFRWMIISENESAEELTKTLCEIPATGLFQTEISPLCNFDESINITIDNIDKGDRLFPGSVK